MFFHKAMAAALQIRHAISIADCLMMGTENTDEIVTTTFLAATNSQHQIVTTIPVVQETFELGKETIETGKVRISKKVTSSETEVSLPLTSETYEVVRIPVNQVVAIQPEAVRYEGDIMIIPVIKEVLVIEKRYEIIEELHITKHTTEKSETQYITLRQEEVEIERTPLSGQEGIA